jgi:two-component system, sensor histidine kinase and response regulator
MLLAAMTKIYDYAASLDRMGNDRELFQEMVGLLQADAPPLVRALNAAHAEGDFARMQRAAHTLKGLAANFGAERAVAAAAEAERLAKSRHSQAIPAAIAELEESFDELIGALTPSPVTSRSR